MRHHARRTPRSTERVFLTSLKRAFEAFMLQMVGRIPINGKVWCGTRNTIAAKHDWCEMIHTIPNFPVETSIYMWISGSPGINRPLNPKTYTKQPQIFQAVVSVTTVCRNRSSWTLITVLAEQTIRGHASWYLRQRLVCWCKPHNSQIHGYKVSPLLQPSFAWEPTSWQEKIRYAYDERYLSQNTNFGHHAHCIIQQANFAEKNCTSV